MVKQMGFKWDHVTVVRKPNKGMHVVQCITLPTMYLLVAPFK